MNDAELLEMAAKATGLEWCQLSGEGAVLMNGKAWNPLNDDGDALRLAVKLQLTVCNEHLTCGKAYCTREEYEVLGEVMADEDGPDIVVESDYAATRRAIVMAAAQIGSAMK